MKNILLASFALLSFSAQAAEFTCREPNAPMDSGYTASISDAFSSATVERTTIAGAETIANLRCEKTNARPSHPDQMLTVATCSEPNLRDAGYSLTVQQGGIAGLTSATLSEVTFVGSRQIAKLYCRYDR